MHQRLHRLPLVLLLVLICASILVPAPLALAQEGTDDPGEIPLQVDVTTLPLSAKKHGGIAYFLFDMQKKIKRFDMQTETWLADITFTQPEMVTSMVIDDDGLFVSFGAKIYRYSLEGTNPVPFYTAGSTVWSMVTCNSFLYAFPNFNTYGDAVTSINKSNGQAVDSEDPIRGMRGPVAACSKGRIYAGSDSSPTDTVYLMINSDGTFGPQFDSPYHGEHFGSNRNYLSTDENRLVNAYGEVFTTVDLVFTKQLSYVDDLDFRIDQPIGLYEGELIGYTNTLAETGRYRPAQAPFKLFTNGSAIYAFSVTTTGLAVESIAASKLRLPAAGQPVSPLNLKYRPDAVVVGKDGIVYLLDRNNFSLYRWSIPERKYLSTVTIDDAALHMAYDSANHRLYLDYPNGQINQIDLASSFQETAFATVPGKPCALTTAEEFVLLCVYSDSTTHMAYTSTGDFASEYYVAYRSSQLAWNSATRSVYYLGSDRYPHYLFSEEISETGILGNKKESPDIGDVITAHPIRITHNGSSVLLGTGEFFDATTLAKMNTLPNTVSDAAWLDDTLFTIYPTSNGTGLQKWSADRTLVSQASLIGEPGFLFNVPEGLLAITYNSEFHLFSIWTTDLEQLFPEFSWTYLPVCAVDYCPDFLDNFDAYTGWVTGESDSVRVELLNGDYRILVKKPEWMWAFASPSCPMENYSVKTAVRWENPGSSYSVVFGIDETMDHFYLLDVDPLSQMYGVWYYNAGYYSLVVYPAVKSFIRTGKQWNNIEVQVHGNTAKLYINDQLLNNINLSNIHGKTRAGVSVSSGSGGWADARFSHFLLQHLDTPPEGSFSLSEPVFQGGETNPVLRPEVQFAGIDALLEEK